MQTTLFIVLELKRFMSKTDTNLFSLNKKATKPPLMQRLYCSYQSKIAINYIEIYLFNFFYHTV
jgi:hypothetical protein